MTDVLRDAFADLVSEEPPMRLDVGQVVAKGRQRRTRRRWTVSASIAAAVVPVLGIGIVAAVEGPVQRGTGVLTSSATPAAGSPAPPTGPTSAGLSPTPSTGGSRTAAPHTAAPTAAPAVGTSEGLADPGFEANPVSWDVFGPATVLTATAIVHSGRAAVRITRTAPQRDVAGATSRPVRVITEAGARYAASCWVRATAPLDAYVQVQEYTSAWVRDNDPVKSPRFTLTDPAVWYRISVSYTAARTGNLLPLTVFGSDMVAGGAALLADDCSLRRT